MYKCSLEDSMWHLDMLSLPLSLSLSLSLFDLERQEYNLPTYLSLKAQIILIVFENHYYNFLAFYLCK